MCLHGELKKKQRGVKTLPAEFEWQLITPLILIPNNLTPVNKLFIFVNVICAPEIFRFSKTICISK